MKKIIFVALAVICMAACSSNKSAVVESDTDSVEMVDTICVDTLSEIDSVL